MSFGHKALVVFMFSYVSNCPRYPPGQYRVNYTRSLSKENFIIRSPFIVSEEALNNL